MDTLYGNFQSLLVTIESMLEEGCSICSCPPVCECRNDATLYVYLIGQSVTPQSNMGNLQFYQGY